MVVASVLRRPEQSGLHAIDTESFVLAQILGGQAIVMTVKNMTRPSRQTIRAA
jgi:hypothetical protein